MVGEPKMVGKRYAAGGESHGSLVVRGAFIGVDKDRVGG